MKCNVRPYEGNEPYIFFSYCHENARQNYPIIEQMAYDGYRIWYDDGLHPGDEWPERIAQMLDGCAVCMVALSRKFSESHNCKNELTFAINNQKALLVIKLEDFPLSMGMRLQLSNTQYIEKYKYTSEQSFFEKLYSTQLKKLEECKGTPEHRIAADRDLTEEGKQPAAAPLCSLPADTVGPDTPAQDIPAEPKIQDVPVPEPKIQEITVPEPKIQDVPVPEPKIQEITVPEPKIQEIAVPEPKIQDVPVPEPKIQNVPVPEPKIREIAVPEPKIQEITVPEPKIQDVPVPEPKIQETAVPEPKIQDIPVPKKIESTSKGIERMLRSSARSPVIIQCSSGRYFRGSYPLTSIGRDKNKCKIYFPENHAIGRHHIDIIVHENRYYIVDRKSVNHTWVDGKRLEKGGRCEIGTNVEIKIADEALLVAFGDPAEFLIEHKLLVRLQSETTKESRYLSGETFVLGRGHAWADGVLSKRNISRTHAILRITKKGCVISDVSTYNQTWVNERRIPAKEEYLLADKDVIRIGGRGGECFTVYVKKLEEAVL